MEYNTSRNQISVPEYGRNVQKIVEYAISIEDREERTQLAKYLVRMMSQMDTSSGNYGDNEQKIWDHLFIISDYKLDVDAPYPMPDKEKILAKPKPMSYTDDKLRFRTYGRNLENIIAVAIEMEEGEQKTDLVKMIAHNLKKAYLTWNKASVDDEQIRKDLDRMSQGRLVLPDDYVFPSANDLVGKRKPFVKNNNNKNNSGKNTKSNYNNKNKNNNKQQKKRPNKPNNQ